MSRLHLALFAVLTLLLLAACGPFTASDESTEQHEAFVYGINAASLNEFYGTFAPPSTETIYLLANRTSVISARSTEIYFWPITNEYRADWNARNEVVPGDLVIKQDGDVVAELEQSVYTIHYRQEGEAVLSELFVGDEAVQAEAEFRAKQQAFQEASAEYQQKSQEWIDAITAAQQGQDVDIPPEPQRPEPIGIYSNGLHDGYPIDLEPGRYSVALRTDTGEVVEDSERDLVIFDARQKAVGYTVVPEERWTTPDASESPQDVILGDEGSTLYLEPHVSFEFPGKAWARLTNPQDIAAGASDWTWVAGSAIDDADMQLLLDGDVVDQRALTPYSVEQLPNSRLGYQVVEYSGSEGSGTRSDFEAYPVSLEQAGQQISIRLVSNDGQVLAGSSRSIRSPSSSPAMTMLVLPLIPLVIGGAFIFQRQRRARLPRSD